ncbi:MAG: RsmG family class I SAM-dependent methyltransferase, partial [Paeniclostridium sordellii]|nr:RsmG family class I SAM-dependent methyltransferase [Paeniclostridium sordellii]
DNVEVYTGRIEDLAREEPASFAAVTARALAQLSILMEFASPLLQEGGRLICYKANVSDEELDHAVLLQDRLAMKLVSDRTVTLGENCRRIICFEKAGTPQVKLPRKTGLAQKRPLYYRMFSRETFCIRI